MATKTPTRSETKSRKSRAGGSTGALIGAAAAGVAVGLAANLGRKLAVQAPTAMAADWVAALTAEHKMALKLFDSLEATPAMHSGKRAALLAQIKHALAKHALQEENVIYPALREAGDREAADRLNHDHGYVKQYLYELEAMPKENVRFLEKLAEFRADLEKHMRVEETDLFPGLKSRLSEDKNKHLAMLMNKEGFKLA